MTSHPNRRRAPFIVVPFAVLGAVVLGMAGCSGNSGHPSGTGGSATAPSSSGPATVTPPSTGPSTTVPPSTVPPSTAPAPATGLHDCATSQLAVVQTDVSVGAGQYYSTLAFTNTSDTACSLTGYPGVSYVGENGVQSGNPADRSPGTVTTVTLQPHGTAGAVLHDANGTGGYDPAECRLSPAEGLRIYPPNQTAALFLPWRTEHCLGPTVNSLMIGPVQQNPVR
ncbi:DUF4232 domain-containing protein [Kitasatospora sp. NBC_00039]|uniref:DUF4232 domain-containing protein n=1 Tax=Kitasatospora sp. NBC_00039 TaxID=2903565 RepID=UPI002F91A48F